MYMSMDAQTEQCDDKTNSIYLFVEKERTAAPEMVPHKESSVVMFL
jgi:hypothetical protein